MYKIQCKDIKNFISAMCKRKRRVVKNFFSNISIKSLSKKQDIYEAVCTVFESGIAFRIGVQKYKSNYEHPQLKKIATKIHNYFTNKGNALNEEGKFDEFHEALCKMFLKIDSSYTYGNAQKMINMTFKYLSCFKDYNSKADLFSYCHMPIDSFILSFLEKNGVKGCGNKKYNGVSWTSLDYKQYKGLLKAYRSHIYKPEKLDDESFLSFEYRIWYAESTKSKLTCLTIRVSAKRIPKFFL